VALLVAFAAAGLTAWLFARRPSNVQGMDFTYPWLAGRALLERIDPYAYVRAHPPLPWTSTLFYPATAAVLAMPFAWCSARVASTLFVAGGFGFLAYHLARDGWWRLAMLLSAPAYAVCWSAQWSPLLVGAALYAPALGLLAAKPNFALPLLAYQRSRRAIGPAIMGGLALLLVSLLLAPSWPLHWIQALRSAPEAAQYAVPLFTRYGWILTLATLRWRRPEGRMLLGLACVPQNFLFYDQLMLLLVATTLRETLVLATLSWVAFLATILLPIAGPDAVSSSHNYAPLVLATMYLPALVLVLRRPNVSG
jgi:hypothetical protein